MSFLYATTNGSFEQRWVVYALLRDCVQHHLEGGTPSAEFGALHAVSEALVGRVVHIDAGKLNAELKRAKGALAGRPISELALSMRTRSVITLHWPPPKERATSLAGADVLGLPLIGDLQATTLDDVFSPLLDALIALTEPPATELTVRDL